MSGPSSRWDNCAGPVALGAVALSGVLATAAIWARDSATRPMDGEDDEAASSSRCKSIASKGATAGSQASLRTADRMIPEAGTPTADVNVGTVSLYGSGNDTTEETPAQQRAVGSDTDTTTGRGASPSACSAAGGASVGALRDSTMPWSRTWPFSADATGHQQAKAGMSSSEKRDLDMMLKHQDRQEGRTPAALETFAARAKARQRMKANKKTLADEDATLQEVTPEDKEKQETALRELLLEEMDVEFPTLHSAVAASKTKKQKKKAKGKKGKEASGDAAASETTAAEHYAEEAEPCQGPGLITEDSEPAVPQSTKEAQQEAFQERDEELAEVSEQAEDAAEEADDEEHLNVEHTKSEEREDEELTAQVAEQATPETQDADEPSADTDVVDVAHEAAELLKPKMEELAHSGDDETTTGDDNQAQKKDFPKRSVLTKVLTPTTDGLSSRQSSEVGDDVAAGGGGGLTGSFGSPTGGLSGGRRPRHRAWADLTDSSDDDLSLSVGFGFSPTVSPSPCVAAAISQAGVGRRAVTDPASRACSWSSPSAQDGRRHSELPSIIAGHKRGGSSASTASAGPSPTSPMRPRPKAPARPPGVWEGPDAILYRQVSTSSTALCEKQSSSDGAEEVSDNVSEGRQQVQEAEPSSPKEAEPFSPKEAVCEAEADPTVEGWVEVVTSRRKGGASGAVARAQ